MFLTLNFVLQRIRTFIYWEDSIETKLCKKPSLLSYMILFCCEWWWFKNILILELILLINNTFKSHTTYPVSAFLISNLFWIQASSSDTKTIHNFPQHTVTEHFCKNFIKQKQKWRGNQNFAYVERGHLQVLHNIWTQWL